MMNCHYISIQLERIQEAKLGAGRRLSTGGSRGLANEGQDMRAIEEQLQSIESAISRIRDEMRRRERAPYDLFSPPLHRH